MQCDAISLYCICYMNVLVVLYQEDVCNSFLRYHQMMISKVKPLHTKVEETTKTVNEASGKLSILQNKLEDLEARLRSLARAYEEASIDKCRQFKLTEKLNLQLERASFFEKVSNNYIEHERP